jgi:tetratricopeptide (TPR) repeat protein
MPGWLSVIEGQHEAAIDQLTLGLQLSPLEPTRAWMERGIAAALFHLERYQEAVPWAAKALTHEPDNIATLRIASAVNAMAGNLAESRRIMGTLLRGHPDMRISTITEMPD